MRNRFVYFGAVFSVLAFLAWIFVSAKTDQGVLEAGGSLAVSASASAIDAPVFRERTGGSAISCAVPLGWHIARVDAPFGLSNADARAAVNRAASLWEEAVGVPLFSNDPEGELSVRLVYDDRQERTRQMRRIEVEYNDAGAILEGRRAGLTEMSSRNDEMRLQVQADLRELDQRVRILNDSIRGWNERGGAPTEVGARLSASGDRLDTEREELTARRIEIDEQRQELREEAERLVREVEAHRSEAEALLDAFPVRRLESGLYREAVRVQVGGVTSVTREIRIFRFDGLEGLVRVAAHELGHALGLAHNEVPGGIMRVAMSQTDLSEGPPAVQPGDVEALRLLCPEL